MRAHGLSLLAIAHRLGVTINYAGVMSEIAAGWPRLDPINQSEIAEKFDIPMQHICLSLVKLIRRADSISRQETGRISLDTLAKVVEAREVYRDLPCLGTEFKPFRVVNSVFELPGICSEIGDLLIRTSDLN
ncbi:hypothetical protein DENSPDRAFT_335257 [Dentipellis sp. KUC8613]|nr:hypothetical protein DENSPDRAFT_335257 [Dentipellis sp. KUC8613]